MRPGRQPSTHPVCGREPGGLHDHDLAVARVIERQAQHRAGKHGLPLVRRLARQAATVAAAASAVNLRVPGSLSLGLGLGVVGLELEVWTEVPAALPVTGRRRRLFLRLAKRSLRAPPRRPGEGAAAHEADV